MAQTTFTIRMDEDTKRDFSDLCANIGLTMSTAFSIFAKKAVSERRIPFELTANADPFYSESNLEHLRRGIAALNAGNGIEHEIIEVAEE